MRKGVNPEKLKETKLLYWEHRVLVPVYIPNLEEEYYKESFEVFKISMRSLLKTINSKQTVITIINNNCTNVVSQFIEDLLISQKIQKHVKYSQNVGKVYPVLSEVKSIYEEYITIADADLLYMKDWVAETSKIFNTYNMVAMVSPFPCPTASLYLNTSFWFANFFRIKKGKVITDNSLELFMQGVNPPKNFLKGKKWDWKDQQYYIEKNKLKACVGAMHFIATYKTKYLRKIPLNRPENVFKGGDEIRFIEKHIDRMGYGRLSSIKTCAYHIGNKLDDFSLKYKFKKSEVVHFRKLYNMQDHRSIWFLFKRGVLILMTKTLNIKN
jgi:hypothetical protein